MTKLILIYILSIWLIFYGCIYISIFTYTITNWLNLNPTYVISDVIGTDYAHVYVIIKGYPLFLSPFKTYSEPIKYFYSTKELINYAPNMWELNLGRR